MIQEKRKQEKTNKVEEIKKVKMKHSIKISKNFMQDMKLRNHDIKLY